jgi:hypothetical protein
LVDWAMQQPLVREVYIFGSRVRGDHGPQSDLDVAVVFTGLDEDEQLAHWLAFAPSWRVELGAKIPIVLDLQYAHPMGTADVVWPAIEREGRRIYLAADPRLANVSDAFHQMGWFIPPFYSPNTLNDLAEKVRAGGAGYPVDRFEAEVQLLFGPRSLTAMVLHRYPQDRVLGDFADSIAQAVEAHLMGMNHVAIAGLMPVVEGAGRRLAVERGLVATIDGHEPIRQVFDYLMRDYRAEVVEHGWGSTDAVVAVLNSFSQFIRQRFYASSSGHGQADNTNRHGVLHGFYPDAEAGRPLTFYKTLSAIDLLSFFGGLQTKSWMGPTATPESDQLALAWTMQGAVRNNRRAGRRLSFPAYLSLKRFIGGAMGVPFAADLV